MTNKIRSPFWDFNPRIFKEGFRQLRTVGILALVILCLAAVIAPVGIAIDCYSYLPEGEKVSQSLVSLMDMHPLVVAPMFTMALIMPLMVFGFLNKRRSSDFYHAIPVNRSALFISLFAAMMAWIVLVIVASSILSVITTLCFSELFHLNLTSILPFMCSCIAGSLLVAGCMTMAMCITGTIFNNLLVAALIFFGPRLLMMYVALLLTDAVYILPDTLNTPFLDFSYNIPMGIPYTMLFEGSTSEVLHNWDGILYTTLIGLLWFLVSLVLFRIRGSESAERPASTPLLQHVYRLTVTFIVTLIPTWGILNCILDADMLNAPVLFVICVLYLVAAVVFCIYELITTKKPKQLLKVAKTFPLVLVADTVLIIGLLVGIHTSLAFRPDASEITSLSFTQRYDLDDDYFAARAAKVSIKDKEVIALAAKRLDEAAAKNDPMGKIEGQYKYQYELSFYDYLVTFRTNGATKQRLLCFTDEEANIIFNAMEKNAEYQSIYQLPEPGNTTTVDIYDLTQTQSDEVYRMMCKEIAALPFEQRLQYLSGNHPADARVHAYASVQTALGAKDYFLDIMLTEKYCPKATDLYLKYLHENTAEERDTLQAAASDFAGVKNDTACLSVDVTKPDGNYYYLQVYYTEDPEINALLKQFAQNIEDRAPNTENDLLYQISYHYEEESQHKDGEYTVGYHHFSSYVVLNEDGIAALNALASLNSETIDVEWYD